MTTINNFLPIITYLFRSRDGLRYTFRRQLPVGIFIPPTGIGILYLINNALRNKPKKTHLVGQVGLEPTLPYGPVLQTGVVPTTLY